MTNSQKPFDLNFLHGIDPATIKKISEITEKESTRKELAKSNINEYLPNLKWDNDKTDAGILYELLCHKFPDYGFEFDEKYKIITINKLCKNDDYKYYIWDGNSNDILDFFKLLNLLKKKKIVILNEYQGFYNKDFAEIAVITKFKRQIDNFISISHIININGNKVKIDIDRCSEQFNSIFKLYMSVFFTVKITGINISRIKDKSKLLKLIENNIIYQFFQKDYIYSIEFRKYEEYYTSDFDWNFGVQRFKSSEFPNEFELRNIDTVLAKYLNSVYKIDFPPFKYLAYYQIIELFAEEVLKESLLDELRRAIKLGKRGSNDSSQIVGIDEKLRSMKKDENKLLNILKKYVSLREFLSNFPLIKENIPSVKTSGGVLLNEVNISSDEDFHKSLKNRIYTLRNSIVHSKQYYRAGKPALSYDEKDRGIINDHIGLLGWIANMIINKNSKVLNKI